MTSVQDKRPIHLMRNKSRFTDMHEQRQSLATFLNAQDIPLRSSCVLESESLPDLSPQILYTGALEFDITQLSPTEANRILGARKMPENYHAIQARAPRLRHRWCRWTAESEWMNSC